MTNPTPEALRIWQEVIAAYDKAYAEHVPVTHAVGREKSTVADQAAARIITRELAEKDAQIAAFIRATASRFKPEGDMNFGLNMLADQIERGEYAALENTNDQG